MKIRIFGLQNDSIVDGPGIRYAIFTQGCYHNCKGCHNPESHDINGGKEYDVDSIVEKFLANPLIDGITFSGGEPFLQAIPLSYIADKAHENKLSVIAYTGYTFEEIISGANEENCWKALLDKIDILVDGEFILDERSIELNFKGSKNQRMIDIPKTLTAGELVLSEYN